jgi:hypothetical protein
MGLQGKGWPTISSIFSVASWGRPRRSMVLALEGEIRLHGLGRRGVRACRGVSFHFVCTPGVHASLVKVWFWMIGHPVLERLHRIV